MNKSILITPQAFLYYKSLIQNKFKRYQFKFVKGPINNKKKLSNYLKSVDACIIGSEKIDYKILKDQTKIKTICRFGTNIENIDVKLCKKKKIKISYLKKNINAKAVARHSLALLLSITNNLKYYSVISKENIWIRKKNISPFDTKIGIIGMGNIGKIFFGYLKKLEFKVNYFSRTSKKNLKAKYYNSLEKLIKNSDILSIHLPSSGNTKKLFSKKIMRLLKGKILINTSRGDLLNEKVLYTLLKKNYIKYAALDVFDNEPTIKLSKKLRNLNNVLSTCHSSFYDNQTIKKMIFSSLEKLKLKA
jgi:D-3-phosphoglycerate dehydrogenase